MYRLKYLAGQCEFTNADEVVKFLFLIHKKHSEVKQKLLNHVTKDTTLGQYLEYACSIEGNLQSVKLSKYVDTVKPHASNTEGSVNAIDAKKKFMSRRCDVTSVRQNSESCDDESPKCDKCGLRHKPKECPAFGKQCYRCGKDNHYVRLCWKTSKKVSEVDYEQYDTVEIQGKNHNRDQYAVLTGSPMMVIKLKCIPINFACKYIL